MGHEIAMQIRKTKEEGCKLILILPVGPMGMYKWAVYFLKEWNVDCKHVYGFNMDEWSDAEGAKQVLVYGIGRMCHIAFWEPHFADEYETEEAWLAELCRIGARLHPFTIEQNAITSFRSSWQLIPCYANTIGPKIIFGSDYAIGGADGVLSRGMQWQGMSFWMTLRYGPTKAVTSSRIPTMPGKLFFMQELAGPLCADTIHSCSRFLVQT